MSRPQTHDEFGRGDSSRSQIAAEPKKQFSLAARAMLLVSGVGFMVLTAIVVVGQGRPKLDADGMGQLLGVALALLVGGGGGGALVWLAITYRELSRAELESLDTSLLPPVSDDAIVCRFTVLGRTMRRIVVDFGNERVHFHRCHTQRKFLAVAQSEFSCSFNELVDVFRVQHKGDSLTVVTTTGKAVIPMSATDYEILCARLPGCLPEQRAVVDVENPLMGILYVAAAVVGLFVGVAVTPRAASVGVMGLLMVVGAGCGVFLIRAAVVVFNAAARRSIVPALAGGLVVPATVLALLGSGLGWAAGGAGPDAQRLGGWTLLAIVVLGSILGFIAGLKFCRPIDPVVDKTLP